MTLDRLELKKNSEQLLSRYRDILDSKSCCAGSVSPELCFGVVWTALTRTCAAPATCDLLSQRTVSWRKN